MAQHSDKAIALHQLQPQKGGAHYIGIWCDTHDNSWVIWGSLLPLIVNRSGMHDQSPDRVEPVTECLTDVADTRNHLSRHRWQMIFVNESRDARITEM